MSTPPATTATVPTASAASCAAVSMPRARPDTTTSPAKPRSRDSMSANLRARAQALRAPTMATISFCSRCGWPRTLISGGGASSAARPRGNSASQEAIMRPPSFASCSISRIGVTGIAAARNSCRRRGCARRGNSASAADAEPKRAIRLRKVTGPDMLGARQPQPGAAFVRCAELHYALGSDARFFAAQQPADIVAVHDEVIRADSRSASGAHKLHGPDSRK